MNHTWTWMSLTRHTTHHLLARPVSPLSPASSCILHGTNDSSKQSHNYTLGSKQKRGLYAWESTTYENECMHVCVLVGMCVFMYVYECVCMFVSMYSCMYMYMLHCMNVYSNHIIIAIYGSKQKGVSCMGVNHICK